MVVGSKDFQIDADNLDKEWMKQPMLYSKYAKALADARREMDEAKNVLEVTKAEVSLVVRQNPENFGLAKITEASLSQVVDCSDKVKSAVSNHIEARHHHEVLQAAIGAMDHKKKALESLVSLWLADYFATPKAKGASKQRMEEESVKKAYAKR